MLSAHAAAVVTEAEAPLLAAGVPLMERAAFALATHVCRALHGRGHRVSGSVVLLLVGGGNNGGDALYAGTHLARRGCQVHAALLTDRAHPAALAAARAAGVRTHAPADAAALVALARRAGVWVDGLTGIGARDGLREPFAALVAALADERAASPDEPLVVAVDVPSGIGVDDGTLPGPVLPADLTVTMGSAKPGLLLPPAADLVGRVEVVDLGLEQHLAGHGPAVCRLGGADVADLWPVPGPTDHKYSRGVLGVVAGSSTYPGAAALTTAGALRTGVGMIRLLGPDAMTAQVRVHHPEVVAVPGRVQAWVVGPGVAAHDVARLEEAAMHLRAGLAAGAPVVLDAGGLTLLHDDDAHLDLPATVVLTPHAGELAELLAARGEVMTRDEVVAAPARHARLAAEITGATVLLKGAGTVVAAPDGPLYAQRDATAWLATAGAGDVLAGVLGALLAAYGDVLAVDTRAGESLVPRLAAAAALVHGRAARLAAGQHVPDETDRRRTPARDVGGPITAGDVAAAVPLAVRALLR